MTQRFDLLVLGGGPGGYVAALRAAQLGLKVCLVEKEQLGGVCLNKGCIPSKILLAGTELFTKIQKAEEWGIELREKPVWNLEKLFEKKEEVVSRLRQGLETLCQKRKVFIAKGQGVLKSPNQIEVGSELFQADKIILATGSSPKILDLGIQDSENIFSSQDALSLKRVPGTLLVLGGGPEGCEFSLIYRGLGAKVILVEAKDRLLPGLDRDAGAAIKRALSSRGIEIFTGESLLAAAKSQGKIKATLKSGGELLVDSILVSVGRIPNSQGSGFETAGVQCDLKKAVITDKNLKTNSDSIYAIGDLAGKYMMAHSASYEGYVTASRLAGKKENLDYRAVPSVVYTYPEAAEVGLNEEKVKEKNIPYEIGRFSFMALGRSHAKGQTEGFVKIIGDAKTNEVLGGVIVGDGAAELINMITLAIRHKLKVKDLREHLAPHPSASEAVVEAAHLFFKEGLHFA
ncbi:MAG: dihydrolipoyl dehydrogenase [Candidatus Omnitrophica bacterium CG1_02_46_14]|nr:MAG: dihydrolipoyl dehydrogenase [Candidatus Omnitrophica bacterium CG1_02_46_14]